MIQNKRLKGGLSKDEYMEILLTYPDDNQTVPFFLCGFENEAPICFSLRKSV